VTPATSRRDELCDAAIEVIARAGLRGLTHRAVDQAAGVAEGSTSYYFRTRLALLDGVTQRLLAADLADTVSAPRGDVLDLDVIADLAAQTVGHWTRQGHDRMLVRYEISLESVRQPELRAAFLAAGVGLRARTVELFEDLGVADPERKGRDFVALLDGLIYDQVAGAGGERSTSDIRATVREILSAFTGR
jgi:DNA-binding transcriptional regulator YbjK